MEHHPFFKWMMFLGVQEPSLGHLRVCGLKTPSHRGVFRSLQRPIHVVPMRRALAVSDRGQIRGFFDRQLSDLNTREGADFSQKIA